MSSSPPSTLGQYQIIREIARSNDIVYEAYDPLMNRRVAVKELAMPHGATSQQQEERISRFRREAQAAGTLNHPNIMTVFSFAEDAGRTFMAMEYLDGHTLRNEIDTKGFLPQDRAVEVALSVLEGLGHAHSKGVIHRDIKPDNIQVLSTGQVKITDFGIARLTFQPNLTMDGQVFGTPSYMSPEQVVGRDIDARSDLFSVGVVLYEMLTGQKPFAGDSVVSITYAIMNKEPQQPQQVSWALWQVLSRALDKSPQMRYASAQDMADALRNAERQAKSGTMTSQPSAYGTPPQATGSYAPYQGGYGTPPPVIQNPYQGGYGQPTQAPYGQPTNAPYGQPPANPYPTPYGNPAPYNPYQQAPPPQSIYTTPMPSMPPPGPIPVYYPPPPRQPLLKPEQVVFAKKIAITFVLVGTLFAVIIVALSALMGALQAEDSRRKSSDVVRKIDGMDRRIPVDERIRKGLALRSQVQDASARREIDRSLAVLYEELANKELTRGNETEAELNFQEAITMDGQNPAYHAALAKLYDQQARRVGDLTTQFKFLQNAGQQWRLAHDLEPDLKKKGSYGDAAARALYGAAEAGLRGNVTDPFTARQLLNDAREAAPSGSEIARFIDDALVRLASR